MRPGRGVLVHAVERGASFSADDFVLEARDAASARGALAIEDLVGMEASRRLLPGSPVRAEDAVRVLVLVLMLR